MRRLRLVLMMLLLGSLVGLGLPEWVRAERPVDEARRKFIQDILPPNASIAADPARIEYWAMQARAQAMQAKAVTLNQVQTPQGMAEAQGKGTVIYEDGRWDIPVYPNNTLRVIADHLGLSSIEAIQTIEEVEVPLTFTLERMLYVTLKTGRGPSYIGTILRDGTNNIAKAFYTVDRLHDGAAFTFFRQESLQSIAQYLGVGIGDISSIESQMFSNRFLYPPINFSVHITLRNGKRFMGTILEGYDMDGNEQYHSSVNFLRPTYTPYENFNYLGADRLQFMAGRLGTSAEAIESVQSVTGRIRYRDYGRVFYVTLKNGKHYIGTVGSKENLDFDWDTLTFQSATLAYYRGWIDLFGAKNRQAIAQYLGVGIDKISSIEGSRRPNFWTRSPFHYAVRIRLNDGREFMGTLRVRTDTLMRENVVREIGTDGGKHFGFTVTVSFLDRVFTYYKDRDDISARWPGRLPIEIREIVLLSHKGKPAARRGRKATDLTLQQTAGLPRQKREGI